MRAKRAYRDLNAELGYTMENGCVVRTVSDKSSDSAVAVRLRAAAEAWAALFDPVEAKQHLVSVRDEAEEAAIVAVLRDGETVESFVEAQIKAEVERRARSRLCEGSSA